MSTYNIMVIDDTYGTRKTMYQSFLEKEYEGIDIRFKLFSIEFGNDLKKNLDKYEKQIDAFFLDAVLEENGWGGGGNTFETVLSELRLRYSEGYIPPVFMLSSQWHATSNLLTSVNKKFAIFHNPFRPCRYYEQTEIEGIIKSAGSRDYNGELMIGSLSDERKFIKVEIDKARSTRYQSVGCIERVEPVDIVLQLAVPDEKLRAYQVFGITQEDKYLSQYNLTYKLVSVEKNGKECRIAVVTQSTMGMTDASRTATAALLAFRPKLIVMTGICAGFKGKTKLGDLIIAKNTFDYSFGKLFSDRLEHRPTHRNVDTRLTSFVNSNLLNQDQLIFADINSNYNGDNPPIGTIHFTSMGSGPWVVDNANVFEQIRDHLVGNCISLDMEAYGVSVAADQMRTPWLIMKSVQDYADGKKSETEKSSRAYAAFSSTYILKKYIHKILEYL